MKEASGVHGCGEERCWKRHFFICEITQLPFYFMVVFTQYCGYYVVSSSFMKKVGVHKLHDDV